VASDPGNGRAGPRATRRGHARADAGKAHEARAGRSTRGTQGVDQVGPSGVRLRALLFVSPSAGLPESVRSCYVLEHRRAQTVVLPKLKVAGSNPVSRSD
jgi:hypothetical protein